MFYYKITGFMADGNDKYENEEVREYRIRMRKLNNELDAFNKKLNNKAFFFPVEFDDAGDFTGGAIVHETDLLKKHLPKFLKLLNRQIESVSFEEVTMSTIRDMLNYANRSEVLQKDGDEVLGEIGVNGMLMKDFCFGSQEYAENLLEETTKAAQYAKAEALLAKESLNPELDRIYAGRHYKSLVGNPCHYTVATDDRETRKSLYRLLLSALYANKRLKSKRYYYMDINSDTDLSAMLLDAMYGNISGGAVIVRYMCNDAAETDQATDGPEKIEILCEAMKKYRNQVLTIFCLPRECTEVMSLFRENLGTVSLVDIKEEPAFDDSARAFLNMVAAENHVKADASLAELVEPGKGYLGIELRQSFDEWYNKKLKTELYPQYKHLASCSAKVAKAAPKGTAFSELEEMIGLDSAKKIIKQAISLHKAQKMFSDRGIVMDRPSMHMAFLGNPGSAKTTVARLFSQIMKENQLLSKGHLVECDRSDLVGKYVGWTAKIVSQKFKEASGGVLFIDEAYSLVDDRSGSFGDEAINEIVKQMEDHRQDVCVIFAGYTEPMNQFLSRNPGLKSRIFNIVQFEDYNTDELMQIAELHAKKKNLILTEGAKHRLSLAFDSIQGNAEAGNGRYVRNVLEKACMAQASRLLQMNPDELDNEAIRTLVAEDIELPEVITAPTRCPIGFAV